MNRSPIAGPTLAAAGLALVAASLARTQGLLAGAEPPPTAVVMAATLVGLALGSARPATAGTRARAAAVLAGVSGALAAFLAPTLLAGASGASAAFLVAAFAGLPAVLAGHAGLAWLPPSTDPGLRRRAALLCGAGTGLALGSAVLLPLVGPSITGLVGGALLLASRRPETEGASASEDDEAPAGSGMVTGLMGAAAGLLLSAAPGAIATLRDLPWTFGGLAAGAALLGAACGTLLLRRSVASGRPPRLLLFASSVLTLLAVVPGLMRIGAELIGRAEMNALAPAVGLPGGPALLLLVALAAGLAPGLLAGACLGTRARGAPLLLGAAVSPWIWAGLAVLTPSRSVGVVLGGVVLLACAASVRPRSTGRLLAVLAVLAAGVCLLGLAWRSPAGIPSDERVTGHEASLGSLVVLTESDEGGAGLRRSGWSDGRLVMDQADWRATTDLLAGHLAALLPEPATSILVVGDAFGRTRSALAAEGLGAVRAVQPSMALARAARILAPALPLPGVAPVPTALAVDLAALDAVIIDLGDPSVPAFAPWFTAEAHDELRRRLRPGGVLVERLDATRLGPDQLLRQVLLAAEVFPGVRLASADVGRSGHYLLVGVAPEAGADDHRPAPPLPFDRLVLDPARNDRLTPAARGSLASALLVGRDDLLHCFVAGQRETARLAGSLRALTPWAEGDLAVRFRAPASIARDLTRGLLYGANPTVDLDLEVKAAPATTPFSASWSLVGIETNLPEAWDRPHGEMRILNTPAVFRGVPGVARESSRRLVIERAGGRLTITEELRSEASMATLTASIRALWSDDVRRSGQATLHGHPALWAFAEPSADEQVLHVTWHCPEQGRLYAVELRTTDGRPGMPDEPLDLATRKVRCTHAQR